MIRWTVVLLVGLLLAPAAWAADEDTDLNRIPTEAPPAAALTQSAATSKDVNYIGDALETSATRNGLAVPFPSPQPPSWEDWLFLDTRDEWTLGPEWRLNYSGRLNVRTSNSIPFPTHETVRNDLRELFVEWQPTETAWLELGRVNIRNGVALGFNPTDFLRPRTVIEPLTADPSVLREDRLGVLMLTGQWLWSSRSMTVAFAPKVTRPTPIIDIRTEQSFDPELGQTNTDDRVMIKVSLNLADTFNPELLYYHAGDRTQIGTNLTTPISRTTVAYLEWAGGVRSDLIADAFRFGRETGSLPASAMALLPNNADASFMNDLSVGVAYATENRITLNLEYHLHQAGFSPEDWSHWFNTSAQRGFIPGVNAALWYLRSYAQDQQEPIERHAAFVRLDWQDAFVTDLELTALATVNLQDASGFLQATAEYRVSSEWTVACLVGGSVGGRRSDFGSLPGLMSALLRVSRHF